MQVGAQPWYLQFLGYAAYVMQVVYPIGVIVILLLAWLDFRRLVNHYAPKVAKEAVSEETSSEGGKEKETGF